LYNTRVDEGLVTGGDMALLTRQEMEHKLSQLFPPQQATGLTELLDNFRELEVQRAADTQELKQGLTALAAETKKLAEAQQRTDSRLGELAEAQRRTDSHVGELAEAQRLTDQHLNVLAEAQRETQVGLTRLERVVETLAREVGGLASRFGFDFEEFVAALLPPWLERRQRISGLTLERRYFELAGGRVEEVDLVREATQNGHSLTVLVECHVTLSGAEVRRLAEKLDVVTAILGNREILKVIVAMNIHPTAEQAAQETGVLLVPYSRINRERP
jgi:hypothetical protein